MRQGRKISKRPEKKGAFDEVRLDVTGSDGRVDFQHTLCEFFDPHEQSRLGDFHCYLQARNYCTASGAMGRNLLIERTILERGAWTIPRQIILRPASLADFRQQLDAVQGGGDTDCFAIGLLDAYYGGLAQSPSAGADT